MTGEKLRRLRDHYGLSQQEAADRVGMSQPSWCRIERGGNVPPLLAWALATERRQKALLERGELLDMTRPLAHPGGRGVDS